MMPIPALEEKIKHLKDELTKEERIKTGVATMLRVAISAVQKKKVEEQLEGSNNKIASIKSQLVAFEFALEIKQQAFQASASQPAADSKDPKDAKERRKTLKRELTTIKATKKTLEKQIASTKEKNKAPKTDLVEQLDEVNGKMEKMRVELEDLEGNKRDHIDIVTQPPSFRFVSFRFVSLRVDQMTVIYYYCHNSLPACPLHQACWTPHCASRNQLPPLLRSTTVLTLGTSSNSPSSRRPRNASTA